MNVKPDIIIVLKDAEESSLKFQSKRRIDPVTGKVYSDHEIDRISSPAITNRLKQIPRESSDSYRNRMQRWESLSIELRYYFSEKLVYVNTD